MLGLELMILAFPQEYAATSDHLERLSNLRIENTSPEAVVLKDMEYRGSVAFSFYKTQSGGSWSWRVRREDRSSDPDPGISWASQQSCAGISDALVAIERVTMPRVEMRSAEPAGSQPPAMGPLHLTHHLWARAWDAGNSPVEVTLTSLGSGIPQRLFDHLEQALRTCWDEPEAPDPLD